MILQVCALPYGSAAREESLDSFEALWTRNWVLHQNVDDRIEGRRAFVSDFRLDSV